jgi:hypothetical protein
VRPLGGNNVSLRLPATCPGSGVSPILPRMFHRLREEAAAAIRTAYEQDRELSAAIAAAPSLPRPRQRQSAGLCADYRCVDATARPSGQGGTAAVSQGSVARVSFRLWSYPRGLPTAALPERRACGGRLSPVTPSRQAGQHVIAISNMCDDVSAYSVV